MANNKNILCTLIAKENIVVNFESEDQDCIVSSLIGNLVATGRLDKSQTNNVSKLIKEREVIGSTAIGDGVAIPHARIDFSEKTMVSFALLENGKGFNALDGRPVKFVFMVLTPKDSNEEHKNVLKAITSFVKNPIHLKLLSGCKTPDEVFCVFEDYAK